MPGAAGLQWPWAGAFDAPGLCALRQPLSPAVSAAGLASRGQKELRVRLGGGDSGSQGRHGRRPLVGPRIGGDCKVSRELWAGASSLDLCGALPQRPSRGRAGGRSLDLLSPARSSHRRNRLSWTSAIPVAGKAGESPDLDATPAFWVCAL